MNTDVAPRDLRVGEILRTAAVALSGHPVQLWESDREGHLHPLTSNVPFDPRPESIRALEAALSGWKRKRPNRARFVATQLPDGQWCAAPVRKGPWRPPPGAERRSAERMTLELAGLCIGLLDEPARNGTTAVPVVDSSPSGLASLITRMVEQVPGVLWAADSALHVRARLGSRSKSTDLLPAIAAGASLRALHDQRKVTTTAIDAHIRALSGESLDFIIRDGDRHYDAHVEPLEGPDGKTAGVIGVAVDATEREHARAAAHESEEELDDFFENLPVGAHWAGPDGTILRANHAELDMLGYSRDEYVGHNVAEFYVDPSLAADCLRRLTEGEVLRNVEIRLWHKSGSIRDALLSSNVRFAGGKFLHTRCVTRDITERKRSERTLARLSAIVDSADDAIIGKTLSGVVTSWNPAAERLFGYTAAEMIGHSIAKLIPPDRPDELPDLLARLSLAERIEHYETTRVRKDGSTFDVSITLSPICDIDGRPLGASAIARDITERKRVEQALRHGVTHDPLTDLPNRSYFIERVSQAMDRAKRDQAYRFAVLFLDFDKFKVVNDSLGHAAGDRLLKEIAERLRNTVRPSDVVARFGGDEFTLLLEDVSTSPDVERATRRIYEAFTAPFELEEQRVYVTVSIGVALSTMEFEKPEDLLRHADLAMYRAKARGRGRFQIFDSEMLLRAHARFGTETDLRNAIDRGEFRLVYQPIVEMKTQRVDAFEALLRWQHPDRGVIQPLEFIPVAEETGQIVPIGEWVLREACLQARRWNHAGRGDADPVRVSINLSARQLGHPRFAERVRDVLRSERLDARCLRLEITETVLMDSVETAATQLTELHRIGVELHMDDFGTGYSSLSLLPRFPLTTLKIDRSFVRRAGHRRTDHELLRSIVDLAKRLGMNMIAEGVETEAQRDHLISFGCALGQGFFFSKPLDADAAGELLTQQTLTQ